MHHDASDGAAAAAAAPHRLPRPRLLLLLPDEDDEDDVVLEDANADVNEIGDFARAASTIVVLLASSIGPDDRVAQCGCADWIVMLRGAVGLIDPRMIAVIAARQHQLDDGGADSWDQVVLGQPTDGLSRMDAANAFGAPTWALSIGGAASVAGAGGGAAAAARGKDDAIDAEIDDATGVGQCLEIDDVLNAFDADIVQERDSRPHSSRHHRQLALQHLADVP